MRLNNWSIAASYDTARIFAGSGFVSSTASRSIISRPRRTGLKRLGAGTVSTMKVVAGRAYQVRNSAQPIARTGGRDRSAFRGVTSAPTQCLFWIKLRPKIA
jgi:hypothetical protein